MASKKSFLSSGKRIRMRDVAERCGVSISTVSLVLSGDPRIPEDTTRKVLQAVKALEYRPSVVARNLARRSSRAIGLILPEFALHRNEPFFYQALTGVHSQSQTAGYKIIVEAASPMFLERRYYLRLLKEQSVDALIYMAAGLGDEFIEDISKEPYPFVLLEGKSKNSSLEFISGDHQAGARLAVEHFLKLGRKKIAHIAGRLDYWVGFERAQGFKTALADHGIPEEDQWVKDCQFDPFEAGQAAVEFARKGADALFVGSDLMAMSAIKALKKEGKNVPSDVAVIGMDDLPQSNWFSPGLTTVSYDIASIASFATKFVINRIQSPLVRKNALGTVPTPTLIIRETCGAKS